MVSRTKNHKSVKAIYDQVALTTSRHLTHRYTTSFSVGIRLLSPEIRNSVYAVYGFVRLADEIVDTFHGYDQAYLLEDLKRQTRYAIDHKISTNPVLHSFQQAVHDYDIEWELIETFLHSMEMDLDQTTHDAASYNEYILGSAEVVGLMCLRIFCQRQPGLYEELKPNAMALGAAFQKINFLRDLKNDTESLGRTYFPSLLGRGLDYESKKLIEKEIAEDFAKGYEGILKLPKNSRFGVYMAYVYFYKLFQKIKRASAQEVMQDRIRISNDRKFMMLMGSYLRHSMNLL